MSQKLDRRQFLKLLPLMSLASAHRRLQSQVMQSTQPNVLFVVFDTLSARHLPLYGSARGMMPNFEKFASRATVYHSHYSAGNFTSPATASMLSGVYPWTHRALSLRSTVSSSAKQKNIFHLLDDKGFTRLGFSQNLLVAILLDQYRESIEKFILPNEIALVDHVFTDDLFRSDYGIAIQAEENYVQNPGSLFFFPFFLAFHGLHQREVERDWVKEYPKGLPGLNYMLYPLDVTMDWLINELRVIKQPFFTYTHFMPPHDPYKPSAGFIDIFRDDWVPPQKPEHFFSGGYSQADLNQRRIEYDEYIAYVDSQFGRLSQFLESSGLTNNTWVILTSDHGEMFERGIWHHLTQVLYQSLLHVPLMISAPGQNERIDVHSLTSSVDLVPTLLHIMDESIPEWCEGEILPPFSETPSVVDRAIYSVEAKSNPKHGPLNKATVAISKGDLKLIYYKGYNGFDGEFEMYDLAQDPEELNDIYDPGKSQSMELKDELLETLARQNDLWRS